MKKAILTVLISAASLAVACAQNYRFYDQYGNQTGSARPNYSGGYNFYDQDGSQTGSARPNYNGGYNFYDRYGSQTGSQRGNGW
jgi:hypothetical protein